MGLFRPDPPSYETRQLQRELSKLTELKKQQQQEKYNDYLRRQIKKHKEELNTTV